MRPWLRDALLMSTALVGGAWAWRLAGVPPREPELRLEPAEVWSLPAVPASSLRRADLLWLEEAPWGMPPPPPPAPPPPPRPPEARPVGIIATRDGLRAVFVVPGGGEFLVKRGQALPGGGRLVSINRFRIAWRDRDGKKREHELLGGPPAPLAPPSM